LDFGFYRVGPGKHGVYQFWDTQAPGYIGKFTGRDDFGVLPVWDILNKVQLKTGMINIPMTYPLKAVNGFIITWPLSNTLRYAYPNDILFEIAKYGGHFASDLSIMYDGNIDLLIRRSTLPKKDSRRLNI
jgi:predicted AlkP superfamily phosphohydrolase/phosphomutase